MSSETAAGGRLHGFPGGLRLKHHKQISCEHPLERPPLPDCLFIPLGQQQGDAGALQVRAGQTVSKGQALTRAENDFQVSTHAFTSGRIGELVDRPASWPPGTTRPCLELFPDGADAWGEATPLADWRQADGNLLISHLREMGLTGLGGAMFPTAAKLRGDWPAIDTLILNGAECEPWISCDETLMRSRPEAVIEGGLVLAHALGAKSILLAIEDQMGETRSRLEKACQALEAGQTVRIVPVATIYPEGGERQLIQTLTGREVPHDGLPQDLGLVCHNVATAAAARDAVIDGRPLVERIVTVTGPGIRSPRNLLALIGTPLAHLVEQAGGYTDDVSRLVLGGPMSGIALADDAIALTKGSNCILALTDEQLERHHPILPCINCGQCVSACPASLMPQLLYKAAAAGQLDQAAELDLFDCIECGCCAQVCPSHIPLVDWYRHAKDELRIKDQDQRRARLAKRRYENRQARLEREQAEREARRQRRREKLAEPEQAQSEIQAAIERARKKKDPNQ